jgi:hypothetical protein
MIRKRSLTVTYELPEVLFDVLEAKAQREGRPLDLVIAEYKLKQYAPRPPVVPEEAERRHQELIALFGTGVSDDPHSSNNERIDADLAREYQGER